MWMDKQNAQKVMRRYGASSAKMIALFMARYTEEYLPMAIKKAAVLSMDRYPETQREDLKERQGYYWLDTYDHDIAPWFVKYVAANNNIEEDIFDIMAQISTKKDWRQLYQWYYEDWSEGHGTPIAFTVDQVVSATLSLVIYWIRENKKLSKLPQVI